MEYLKGMEVPEGRRLEREFFARDGITVAKELLGKVLVHETSLGTIRGVITEVESYMGVEDKGAHTYGGRRTARTEPMFHQGGTSYVYLIYGMYRCMNIAAATVDVPQAVLIRSVEPADKVSGERMEQLRIREIEEKAKRRREKKGEQSKQENRIPAHLHPHLADGPGKLCIAMEIGMKDNDIDMVESESFYVTEGVVILPEQIQVGKRIGIDYAEEAADYLWRFYL